MRKIECPRCDSTLTCPVPKTAFERFCASCGHSWDIRPDDEILDDQWPIDPVVLTRTMGFLFRNFYLGYNENYSRWENHVQKPVFGSEGCETAKRSTIIKRNRNR
jgi:hypothetical protein